MKARPSKRCLTIVLIQIGVRRFGCINSGPFSRFQCFAQGSITHQQLFQSLKKLKAVVLKWNKPCPHSVSATEKKLGLSKLVKETAAAVYRSGEFTAQFAVKILIASGIINRPELADQGYVADGTTTFDKMVQDCGDLIDCTPAEKQTAINQIVATAARALSVTTDVADNLFCEMYRKKGEEEKLKKSAEEGKERQPKKSTKGRCHDLFAVGQSIYKAEYADATWKTCVYDSSGRTGFVLPIDITEPAQITRSQRWATECWWKTEKKDDTSFCVENNLLFFTQKAKHYDSKGDGAGKSFDQFKPPILWITEEKERKLFAKAWNKGNREDASRLFRVQCDVAPKSHRKRTPPAEASATQPSPQQMLSSLTKKNMWYKYVQMSSAQCNTQDVLSVAKLLEKYGRVDHGLVLEDSLPQHSVSNAKSPAVHPFHIMTHHYDLSYQHPNSGAPNLLLPGGSSVTD